MVWIFGANLDTFASVQFGGVEVMSVLGESATNLVVTVPLGAVSGPIAVETPTGTATSTDDFIVMTQPLRAVSASYDAAGRFSFKVTGQTGLPVTIEATADLTFPVVWLNVATNVLPAGGWSFTNQITGSHAQQFFRVKLE